MRRQHATEDVDEPDKTLCGAPLSPTVLVDNVNMDCRRCIKVIRSRCRAHNTSKCPRCEGDNIHWVGDNAR